MAKTSPLEELIQISQRLEQTLKQEFGATGRGLHEQISSVKSELTEEVDETIVKKFRYIATIRNKAVHEDAQVAAENIDSVREASRFIDTKLKEYRKRKNASPSSGCASVLFVALSVVLLLSVCLVF